MNAASVVARAAREAGCRVAWGMPGGDTLPLVDALAAEGIDFVLVRDEASAGFAADASAQLSGGVGLCAATLGPGVTNLLSGVAGALLDRAPVLAVTSRLRSDAANLCTHMVLDQDALFRATGKGWLRLSGAAPAEVRRAVTLARAPRPGPVWLEIPAELAEAEVGEPLAPPPPPTFGGVDLDPRRWERPVILAGFAARHAPLEALAAALRAPVITSYKAKGAVREGRGWSAGAAGLSPVVDRAHRALLDAADGILLLGWDPAELRDHWLPGWSDRPEVFALDEAVPTDLPARLDAVWAGPLAPAVAALTRPGESRWTVEEVAAHRARWSAPFTEDGIGPATAIRAVRAAVGDDVVVALDVGAHRITASHAWDCARPDRLLQSNGLSSMGYGLPAALAAAAHGHPALVITGDMGLQLTLGELGVAAERGWPLVVVVLDDESLSLIALKQRRAGKPGRAVTFRNPRWTALAEAFGARCAVPASPAELSAAVRRALAERVFTLIAVSIDPGPYLRQM